VDALFEEAAEIMLFQMNVVCQLLEGDPAGEIVCHIVLGPDKRLLMKADRTGTGHEGEEKGKKQVLPGLTGMDVPPQQDSETGEIGSHVPVELIVALQLPKPGEDFPGRFESDEIENQLLIDSEGVFRPGRGNEEHIRLQGDFLSFLPECTASFENVVIFKTIVIVGGIILVQIAEIKVCRSHFAIPQKLISLKIIIIFALCVVGGVEYNPSDIEPGKGFPDREIRNGRKMV
jgi:hypothetical protein